MAKDCVLLRNHCTFPRCVFRACVHACVHVCLFSLDKVRCPSLSAPQCLLHYPAGCALRPHSHLPFPSLLILIPSHTSFLLPAPTFFYRSLAGELRGGRLSVACWVNVLVTDTAASGRKQGCRARGQQINRSVGHKPKSSDMYLLNCRW